MSGFYLYRQHRTISELHFSCSWQLWHTKSLFQRRGYLYSYADKNNQRSKQRKGRTPLYFCIDLLRRAFQYAVNRDLVAQNPFENAVLPKTDILKKGVREIDY